MGRIITIEVPDWADERVIHIMAGVERVAYQYPGKPLMVKVERCNWCGKCCSSLGNGKGHPFPVVDGRCVYLKPEAGIDKWKCGLGYFRPYLCCMSDPIDKIPECSIKYESRD